MTSNPYYTIGNSKNETILFIHGLGCTKDYWQEQHELSDKFYLIVSDLRGHGESNKTDDITLDNFSTDMWNLLDQLNKNEPINICGHSLGGLVAQGMFKQQPQRVKSLILANTYSYCIPCFSAMELFIRQFNFTTLNNNDYVELIISNCLYDRKNETLRKRAQRGFHIRKDTYMAACCAGAYANYRKLLPKIKVPTLIISSSHDRVTQSFVQDDMHQKIPGSTLVTLEQCGHLSNIEKPTEFNKAIRDFLNG